MICSKRGVTDKNNWSNVAQTPLIFTTGTQIIRGAYHDIVSHSRMIHEVQLSEEFC